MENQYYEEKRLIQHEYDSYVRKLKRMVREFNHDTFARAIHTDGKKIKMKEVDFSPLPCHYRTIKIRKSPEEIEDEKWRRSLSKISGEGTKDDPIIIWSDGEM